MRVSAAHGEACSIRDQLIGYWPDRRDVPLAVREAASAVSMYCSAELDRIPLTDRHLRLLLARALLLSGDPAAARAIAAEAGGIAASDLGPLLSVAEGPWPAVDWIARGVCRRGGFLAFEPNCLVLDWDRLRLGDLPLLELEASWLLSSLIRCAAPIWDSTRGHGALVHRLPAEGHAEFVQELLWWSQQGLQREACGRGWVAVPDVRLADATY